jgi:hypothetical protein
MALCNNDKMVLCTDNHYSDGSKKILIKDVSNAQFTLIECEGTAYVVDIKPCPRNPGKKLPTFNINNVQGVILNHRMWHPINGKEMVMELKDAEVYGEDGYGEFLCKAFLPAESSMEANKKRTIDELTAEAKELEDKRPRKTERVSEYEWVREDIHVSYENAEQEDIRGVIQDCLGKIHELCEDEANAYYAAAAKHTGDLLRVKKAIMDMQKKPLVV